MIAARGRGFDGVVYRRCSPLFPTATGMRVKPIVVMTDPVTIRREEIGARKTPETRIT